MNLYRNPSALLRSICTAAALLLLASPSAALLGAETGNLRVGVSKVDITPTDLTGLTNLWRTPFEGVHDHIFVRALVLDNGHNAAVLVAADLVEFGDTMSVRERIAKETGIPADHIVLTASHDHNAPRAGAVTPGATAQVGGPATAAYTEKAYGLILDAVRQARAAMQPARVGIGTGRADVNTNRDEYGPKGWRLGTNPEGPSEKTVWVVKFETPAGEPIALLMNYAVHAVVLGANNKLVTGDISGAAERYVEQHYKDKVVALWTIGAAGDQNPKYMSGRESPEPPYSFMESQGQIVGQEAIRVAERIEHMTPVARIDAAERVISCPARIPAQRKEGASTATAPSIALHLGLIRINDIALTAVSGEVLTRIYWHLRKDSPLNNTIMITMANDRIGYIPEDSAYDTPTFEVNSTPLQKGCAEAGIVNNLVEMIGQ